MKKFELSIPMPCHENWESMTPKDKGRFCASCQKTVIDFSSMSDRQIAEFFKKPVSSVCGHFSSSQLNRVVEVPRKRLPWLRYFFTIALPAFFLSMKAGAQGEVRLRGKVAVKVQPDKIDTCEKPLLISNEFQTANGRVVDERGQPVPYATVALEGSNVMANTNEEGNFEFKCKSPAVGRVIITSVGYLPHAVPLSHLSTGTLATISLSPAVKGEVEMGVIVVRKPKVIPLLTSQKKDTAFSRFSIFPNPTSAFSVISIEPKKIEEGTYVVQLVNGRGELLQTGEIIVERKTNRTPFTIAQIPAGPYFLRLINSKSRKSYTEIVIVQ